MHSIAAGRGWWRNPAQACSSWVCKLGTELCTGLVLVEQSQQAAGRPDRYRTFGALPLRNLCNKRQKQHEVLLRLQLRSEVPPKLQTPEQPCQVSAASSTWPACLADSVVALLFAVSGGHDMETTDGDLSGALFTWLRVVHGQVCRAGLQQQQQQP